jgi:hypothetical protein
LNVNGINFDTDGAGMTKQKFSVAARGIENLVVFVAKGPANKRPSHNIGREELAKAFPFRLHAIVIRLALRTYLVQAGEVS